MIVGQSSVRSFSRFFYKYCRIKYENSRALTSGSPVLKPELNSELLACYNQDIKAGGVVPVFRRALLFPSRIAIQDEVGIYTYAGLYQAATNLSRDISAQLLGETERSIAYLCSNNASHVIVEWAIWMSGNIAVPLTPIHPPDMIKYFISDSEAGLLICTEEHEKIMAPIAKEMSKPLLIPSRGKEIRAQMYKEMSEEQLVDEARLNLWYGNADAFLIYTSGTTSKPKGVVWTHSMLQTQIASLHSAWEYSSSDVVLHTLPLHHIHGQLNSMSASLAALSRIQMVSKFESHVVWARLLGMGQQNEAKVTVFHGVPAMYMRLAADYESMFNTKKTKQYVRDTLSRMRLCCAGSAPLPDSLFQKWEQISGKRLLERYGMSEAGMALSNPYRPIEERTVGCVGTPLPGISARIAAVKEDGSLDPLVTVEAPMPDSQISLERLGLSDGSYFEEEQNWTKPKVHVHKKTDDDVYQGELLLKGPGIFTRYYNRASALFLKDFTSDGWFRTGDSASYSENKFKILGRTSIDIIKTSGYKVSAIQVESAILEHPNVADVAVLGIEDDNYGEIVACIVVLKPDTTLTLKELKDEAGKRLAPYQLPKTMLVIKEMPRNAMGKLDKKVIRKLHGEQLRLVPNKK